MEEKMDFLTEDLCDCDDECMKLSLDNTAEDDLDKLWDEADEDDFDVCTSDKSCNRKKCIILALIIGIAVAATAVIVYKLCKKSNKEKD